VKNARRKEGRDMPKGYYRPGEAAERLGITPEELVNLVRDDKLHVRREGEQRVLDAAEVDALAGNSGTAPGPPGGRAGDEDNIDLSQAERSALDAYGGSGLLELTRERYENSLGDVGNPIQMVAGPESAAPPEAEDQSKTWTPIDQAAAVLGMSTRTIEGLIRAGELQSRRRPDGQREVLVATQADAGAAPAEGLSPAEEMAELQIGRTALSMARKLTETHEAQLKRAYRNARLAWVGVVVLLAAAALGWWQGTKQAARSEVLADQLKDVRAHLAAETSRRATEEARAASLTRDLATVREDQRSLQAKKDKLQDELAAAREALAESKASAAILSAELESVKARLAGLNAELDRLKATTQPATKPAAAAGGT
jgi:hypothetical protein